VTAFNLSDWAIRHRSFVAYLMIVLLVAGSFVSRARRNEDPAHHDQNHDRSGELAGRHAERHLTK